MAHQTDERFERLLQEAFRGSPLMVPGSRLCGGRFIVQRLLGAGGMGVVYLATDTAREATIVIKTLALVGGSGIYQLKQEFRSLADLVHPNLMGFHELICDQGLWFITMDYVHGDTMRDFLGRHRSRDAIQQVFCQLAVGIGAIHCAGKLHRDLKPSNVMITPAGFVMILDFGLTCDQLDGAPGLTLKDSISGTPMFMAPEQAAGGSLTQASDWYAYGVMLYEAITGRFPFDGPGREVLRAKQDRAAPPIGNPLVKMGPKVEQLCMALLAREVEARPGFDGVTTVFPTNSVDLTKLAAPVESSPFLGRVTEIADLQDSLEATDRDRPVVVLVSGLSGVGKTALVERFLADLTSSRQGVVLRGRCYERESVPYKACDSLVDALSRHMRQLPMEQSLHLLPRHVHALVRLFPVFERLEVMHKIKQRLALPPDPAELRRRGEGALKELISRLAEEERVVLFVDDAQWSDVDGARLLGSLVSPPDAPAMLLICAFRSEDESMGEGLRSLLGVARGLDGVRLRQICLDGLSEEESIGLASSLLPPTLQGLASPIAADSGGNPFFISLSTRYASARDSENSESGTTGGATETDIDGAIRAYITLLPHEDRDLLEAVCVAGRAVSQDQLREVIGGEDPVPVTRRLLTDHLLRSPSESSKSVVAYHDRIREVILAGLAPSRKTHWHRKFAQAISAARVPDTIALTHHLLGAGEHTQAGETAVGAAQMAANALAFDRAVALYNIALTHASLTEPRRLEVLSGKAEALGNGLRAAESGEVYQEAARLASTDANRGELMTRSGEQLLLSGRIEEGISVLRDAFAEHGLHFDAICAADCGELFGQLMARGLAFEPRGPAQTDPALLMRLKLLWTASLGLSHLKYVETFALALHCTLEALEAGETGYIVRGLMGVSILEAALMPSQPHVFPFLKHLCDQSDDDITRMYLALTEGNIAIFQCRPSRMLDSSKRALALLERSAVGLPRELSMARTLVLSACFLLGDLRRLWNASIPWLVEAQRQNNVYLCTWIHIYQAIHHLAMGEPERARSSVDQAADYWDGQPPDVVGIAVSQYRSLCDAFVGDPRGWTRIVETMEMLRLSDIAQNPLKQSDQALFTALVGLRLAVAHPQPDPLLAAAEKSAAVLESFPSPDGLPLTIDYWAPQASLLHAGLHAARGQWGAALECLDVALELFDSTDSSRSSKACTLRQKGLLVGGTEGDAIIRAAEEELNRLGIVDINRFCALFAPGFCHKSTRRDLPVVDCP